MTVPVGVGVGVGDGDGAGAGLGSSVAATKLTRTAFGVYGAGLTRRGIVTLPASS